MTPRCPDESVKNVGGGRDDVFLEPQVPRFIRKGDASIIHGDMEAGESALGRLQISRVTGFLVRTHQYGDSLPLRERRVPWGAKSVAVFPIEVVIPDGESLRVLLEARAEPVRDYEEFAASFWVGRAMVQVVVSQSVLRDRDGVVLQADAAVIVELRDAGRIVEAPIVRLLGEQHVVFAQFLDGRIRILRGSFMPERKVALATEKVGAENAAVVAEAGQGFRVDSIHITAQHTTSERLSSCARRTAEGGCPHITSRGDGIERGDHVVGFDSHCGQGQEWRRVVAIGHEGVAVLKQAHGPAVFLPCAQQVPVPGTSADAAVETNVAVPVHFARLHHRREEDSISNAASIDGRTADRCNLQQRFPTVEAIDVVRFQWRVGRKIEAIFGRNGCNCASLLLALQDGFDPTEIAGGAQDAAFVAIVTGHDPEAISPGIVNNIMDVADRALGKSVGDAPRRTGIGRRVDVDFVASAVVEIFSPVDWATGNGGDVQRARTAEDGVRAAKFGIARAKRDDSSRNSSDERA